jgi:tetratricopeptide (TPR) repeat protein
LRASSRPAEASAVLERAEHEAREFGAHADIGRASLFLGRVLAAQGRMEDAVVAFDRALALDRELVEARRERGLARGVLVREGTRTGAPPSAEMEALRAEAIADLSAEPDEGASLPTRDTAWGAALLAWLRGDSERAERLCADVIRLDPTHVEARFVLARIASARGEHDRAMFLTAEAVDMQVGLGQAYRDRQQGASAALAAGWARLPGRRELLLDLRKAAAAKPTMAFASGALAQEGLEAGARALGTADGASALRELEAAGAHLTRALRTGAEDEGDPAILAARGVCALLTDEALAYLDRPTEAAAAREAAARDFAAASRLGTGAVRAAAWWNQSLLDERRSLIALLSGDADTAENARDEAEAARAEARAAAEPGSELAALLDDER